MDIPNYPCGHYLGEDFQLKDKQFAMLHSGREAICISDLPGILQNLFLNIVNRYLSLKIFVIDFVAVILVSTRGTCNYW